MLLLVKPWAQYIPKDRDETRDWIRIDRISIHKPVNRPTIERTCTRWRNVLYINTCSFNYSRGQGCGLDYPNCFLSVSDETCGHHNLFPTDDELHKDKSTDFQFLGTDLFHLKYMDILD